MFVEYPIIIFTVMAKSFATKLIDLPASGKTEALPLLPAGAAAKKNADLSDGILLFLFLKNYLGTLNAVNSDVSATAAPEGFIPDFIALAANSHVANLSQRGVADFTGNDVVIRRFRVLCRRR
jgi:hypothetical protein